jgi:hypothetical protein
VKIDFVEMRGMSASNIIGKIWHAYFAVLGESGGESGLYNFR